MTEGDFIRLLEEVAQSEDNPEGAYTTEELAGAAGVSQSTVRNWLRRAMRSGITIELVKVRRRSINDRMMPHSAYRLVRE